MILRKPYAFFIKNFKLIHVVMTLVISYLIYRTSLILTFLNEYINTTPIIVGTELTDPLFGILMMFVPFIIVVASIVILSVMYVKKKPFLFYILSIIAYIALIAVYAYANNIIGQMELKILDIRIVRALRDILSLTFVLQCISVIVTFIRATGFDIKKFNFGQDLETLDIEVEDNEEFELDVEFDSNRAKRKWNYFRRHAKYYYRENKFMIQMIGLVLFASVCFVVYLNLGIYNKTYSMYSAFRATDITLQTKAAYIVDRDYRDTKITPQGITLVTVKVTVKKNYKKNQLLDIARTELIVGKTKFYPVETYRDKLVDLGNTYEDQYLTNTFEEYLLVYEVPNHLINQKMKFVYVDQFTLSKGKMSPKVITTKLATRDLRKEKTVTELELGSDKTFQESILKDSLLKINTAELQPTFTLNYQLCIKTAECYQSVEQIVPNPLSLLPKAVLKLNATFQYGKDIKITNVNNPYQLIALYGKLQYEKDGRTYTSTTNLTRIVPQRAKAENEYYMEVDQVLLHADKVWLVLTIRDFEYRYLLK